MDYNLNILGLADIAVSISPALLVMSFNCFDRRMGP